MEKQPAFDRVIGGTEEHRKAFWNIVDHNTQLLTKENMKDVLSELTEEEKTGVAQAVEYACTLAYSYGATRTVDLKKIFIVHEGMVYELTNGKVRNGFYNAPTQSAFVDRSNSFAITLRGVVHECLHLTSLQVAKIYKDGTHKPHRSGIELNRIKNDVQTDFFSVAQEAIIATLTHRYFNEVIKHNPVFAEQVEKTEIVKRWLLTQTSNEKTKEIIDNILIIPDAEEWCVKIEDPNEDKSQLFDSFVDLYNTKLQYLDLERERLDERKKFDSILNEIIERSNGKIQSKDKLFDHFACAHFTGNLIPLARIIEDALGKGSFREIAEKLGKSKPVR